MIWWESFLVSLPHSLVEALQVVRVELGVKERGCGACSTDAGLEVYKPRGDRRRRGREGIGEEGKGRGGGRERRRGGEGREEATM